MENLALQKQVINLGKLFIKELNLDQSVDTLSRWMAHYVAEKITLVKNGVGEEKKLAEKECFETILKLWERRWSLPSGNRPFKDFAAILKVLYEISPENERPFHSVEIIGMSERLQRPDQSKDLNEVEKLMAVAKEIDKVARIWIEYVLAEAGKKAKNETTEDWLNNSENLDNNDDADSIRIILNFGNSISGKTDAVKKHRIEKLKNRISELERFKQLNETIMSMYSKELADIEMD